MKRLLLRAAAVMCVALLMPGPRAHAAQPRQAAVTFSATEVENRFPISLALHVHVQAGAPIAAARLYYRFRNDSTLSRNDLTVTAAANQVLTYRLVTAKDLAVPGTPIEYYWEVTLAGGEKVRSAEEITYYDDIRYDWDVHDAGNLSLWTHDRTDSFAARALEIASEALDDQRDVFGVELDDPIRIIVYNTDAEFAAWHPTSTELIGGEAFPALGITTQIVGDNAWQDSWLNDVLPHEISHLYFFQVTYHPLAPVPAWLDEGVAQWNEAGVDTQALQQVRSDILDGKYIPLRGLTGSFGYEEEKFGRSYDESLSAVSYLMDRYTGRGLSDLLAAYKSGLPTEQAFPAALGVTVEQFESDWLGSLDLPAGMLPTPPGGAPAGVGAAGTPVATQPLLDTPVPALDLPGRAVGLSLLAIALCLGLGCSLLLLVAFVWLIGARNRRSSRGEAAK